MFVDDLVSPLRVACVLDMAIDRVATDIPAYIERRDPDMVRALPGRRITWFTLKPINSGLFCGTVEGGATLEMRWRIAFQCAVAAIENLEDDVPPWLPSEVVPDAVAGAITVVNDRELEHIRRILGMPWIYEIGKVAYLRAAEGNIRGGGVRYTLPPTSHAGLTQIAHLLAAQSRTTLAQQNSAVPAASSTTGVAASSG